MVSGVPWWGLVAAWSSRSLVVVPSPLMCRTHFRGRWWAVDSRRATDSSWWLEHVYTLLIVPIYWGISSSHLTFTHIFRGRVETVETSTSQRPSQSLVARNGCEQPSAVRSFKVTASQRPAVAPCPRRPDFRQRSEIRIGFFPSADANQWCWHIYIYI